MYNIYETNYLGVNKMNTGLPLRKHVPDNEKWNLEDLFTNDEAFYNTFK